MIGGSAKTRQRQPSKDDANAPQASKRLRFGPSLKRLKRFSRFYDSALLTGEKYREFCRNWSSAPILGSNQRASSMASSQIPYAAEQGICKAVSGNFSE